MSRSQTTNESVRSHIRRSGESSSPMSRGSRVKLRLLGGVLVDEYSLLYRGNLQVLPILVGRVF